MGVMAQAGTTGRHTVHARANPAHSWPTVGTQWTSADLASLPDDGLRYEIVDGLLLVSPAPRPLHQRASYRLSRLLGDALPPGLELLPAPVDWQPDGHTSLQPDLLVMRHADITPDRLLGTPVLIVEISSPATARVDRTIKWERYAEAGVRQYWIVDPGNAATPPTVTVYDLADGTYIAQARASTSEKITITGPVPVSLTPAALIGPPEK